MRTMNGDGYHDTLNFSTQCYPALPHHSLFRHYHFLFPPPHELEQDRESRPSSPVKWLAEPGPRGPASGTSPCAALPLLWTSRRLRAGGLFRLHTSAPVRHCIHQLTLTSRA